jgi:thiol-disulfide isomerase/thioredoxin
VRRREGDRLHSIAARIATTTALAIAVGCTSDPSSPQTPADATAVNATDAPLLPREPTALPESDFGDFQALGEQLVGVPVVINIWSSWCGPCRGEAPAFAAAARTYGQRVQFLGVDVRDERDAAVDFIRTYGLPYPSLFDPSGDIRARLGFVGQPETLFYDDSGNVSSVYAGPIPADELHSRILAILEPT